MRPTAGVSTMKPGAGGGWPGVMMCVQLTRCRRASEADGGRIYHEAWCGWGAAWGEMNSACRCCAATLCRVEPGLSDADVGRISNLIYNK